MINTKSLILVLAALAAFAFLTLYIRKAAHEVKYQVCRDKIEYASMIANKSPDKPLAILDSVNVSVDDLCKNKEKEIEFLKYHTKARCFKSLLMRDNNLSYLDSLLSYCDKAIAIGNNTIICDNYMGNGDAYFLMGWTYQELGDYQKALPYLDKAIETSSKHKEGLLTQINSRRIKVKCLQALGRTREADLLEKETAPLDKILFKEISGARH